MTDVMTDAAIEVTENGPYHVTGHVPLKRVRKVPGDRGSFIEYEVYEEIETSDEYWLCRCGQSTEKPFCSGMHSKVGFDGTETAPTDTYLDRAKVLGGTNVTFKDDRAICAHAAFCSNAATNIWKSAPLCDDDPAARELLIGWVDRCPSGALTYEVDGKPAEPEMEREIRVLENGQYMVRGAIPVRRSDGQPIEVRNRMSLCRCGHSSNKPLCDGTHAKVGFEDG